MAIFAAIVFALGYWSGRCSDQPAPPEPKSLATWLTAHPDSACLIGVHKGVVSDAIFHPKDE